MYVLFITVGVVSLIESRIIHETSLWAHLSGLSRLRIAPKNVCLLSVLTDVERLILIVGRTILWSVDLGLYNIEKAAEHLGSLCSVAGCRCDVTRCLKLLDSPLSWTDTNPSSLL